MRTVALIMATLGAALATIVSTVLDATESGIIETAAVASAMGAVASLTTVLDVDGGGLGDG